MKFSNDQPIWEILKEIQEKQGGEGGQDHGLFQPPANGKKGRWLKPNHTLKFYDVQSGVRDTFLRDHFISLVVFLSALGAWGRAASDLLFAAV